MTQYMLILRTDVTADYSGYSPEDMGRILEAYKNWAAQLAQEGRLIDGKKLADEGGRVMTPGEGGVTVKDGPYVETKEVVGGFYLLKADSFEHAQKLCEGHPNFEFGSIEIREVDCLGEPES